MSPLVDYTATASGDYLPQIVVKRMAVIQITLNDDIVACFIEHYVPVGRRQAGRFGDQSHQDGSGKTFFRSNPFHPRNKEMHARMNAGFIQVHLKRHSMDIPRPIPMCGFLFP